MPQKNNIKQRNKTIQGLRSFKDTLPTSVKNIIKKRGDIFSETLNNWKYIVGNELFKVCYPKVFKNSNKFGVSTLVVMVKRGKEVELEYSKKQIMEKMNSYFGYQVLKKIKLITFEENLPENKKDNIGEIQKNTEKTKDVTISKYINKVVDIKNKKIKKSLIELTKLFKER